MGRRSATDTRRPWVCSFVRLGFPSLRGSFVILTFVRTNGRHASLMLSLVLPLCLTVVSSFAFVHFGARSCVHELFAIISTKGLASYALFISSSTSAFVRVVGAVAVTPRRGPRSATWALCPVAELDNYLAGTALSRIP